MEKIKIIPLVGIEFNGAAIRLSSSRQDVKNLLGEPYYTADDLYDMLSEKNHGEIDDSENGYSYGFLNISVGVYRPAVLEDVEDMIREANEDGAPMDEEEIKDEMKRADYWATIGIGVEGYYR